MDTLLSRPVFLGTFALLSLFYVLLKLRLARPRPVRTEGPAPSPAVAILESSADADELVQALEEVARTRDRRAVEPLGKLLSHPDPRLSAAAANVLGLIGDERALEYLMESALRLESELSGLQPAGEPPPPPGAEPLKEPAPGLELVWPDGVQGRRLLEAHAKPGDAALSLVQALASLASDREAPDDYRYFALKNLELILPGSPGSSPQLARELGLLLSDPSASIRYAAVSALEVMRVGEVARYLEGAISDPNRHVRARACLALAGVAPARARKHLFSLLSDPDEQVRRAAQRTLEEMGTEG